MAYLFGFHVNEIRTQLASLAAEPADFPSGGLKFAAFLRQGALLPLFSLPFDPRPLMLAWAVPAIGRLASRFP
jgi:hypothetical protein